MKVVLDTNVLISGIFWHGNPNSIILAWKERKFDLCISVETLEEFIRIMRDFKIRMPEDLLKEWINLLTENSILIEPIEKFDVVRDKKDNKFIDCAVAAEANYIVSGDPDLTDMKEFRSIKIVKPKEFLDILNTLI